MLLVIVGQGPPLGLLGGTQGLHLTLLIMLLPPLLHPLLQLHLLLQQRVLALLP